MLFDSSTLVSLHVSEVTAFLSCFTDLFTYYQWIENGRFYCVQTTGKISVASKYRSELTLRAANCIDRIR